MSILERSDQDAVLLHGIFSLLCPLVLAIPSGVSVGQRVFGLVLLYNVALPVIAWRRGYSEWLTLWLFLLPLSALLIFPDWFLATELGVIVFPDTGAPMIGPIPSFMAGLWTIPLFVIVLLGRCIAARNTRNVTLLVLAVASVFLLVGSEALSWSIPIWYAQDVATIFHVAVYEIVPEIILGLSTFLAFELSLHRSIWYKLGTVCVIVLIYLGGRCFFISSSNVCSYLLDSLGIRPMAVSKTALLPLLYLILLGFPSLGMPLVGNALVV